MQNELIDRSGYLNKPVETIYFGGGTPSLLSATELVAFLDLIETQFESIESPEITLEANPDDLSKEKLQELNNVGINRLSIGIQSFISSDLERMNRAHSVEEALSSVHEAQQLGIENISIDLMYGLPEMDKNQWKNNIQHAIDLRVPHISAYCLTIEPKTVFQKWAQTGKINVPSNEITAWQFDLLSEQLNLAGYEHYEISNFAQPNHYSKHNTAYWQQKHYLGVGPSAHSFNGDTRSWNTANNVRYALNPKQTRTTEILSPYDQFNELLLTGLRTQWGVDLDQLKGIDSNAYDNALQVAEMWLTSGQLILSENRLLVTGSGRKLTDKITSDLFQIAPFSN